MSTTRRQFLVTAFGSLGAAAVSGSFARLALAQAGAASDRCFVFCYFPGAWDILVSSDPKDRLVGAPLEDTRIEHGWDDVDASMLAAGRLELLDLPHLAADGSPHRVTNAFESFQGLALAGGGSLLDRTTFVRGLSMDTLTHEVGRRRFLTGRPPTGLDARGNSIATMLTSLLASVEPIPNLSAAVESYNATEPAYASALNVNSVDDLLRALRPAALEASPEERERVEALVDGFRDCMLTDRSPARQAALDARSGAAQLVEGGYDAAFDLSANTPAMEVLRERFEITGNRTDTVQARMAMAAQAITSGVSRVVSVQASESCDTHFDNWESDQLATQVEGYRAIAALAAHLDASLHPDGGTWLDRTTVLAFSDFCRTPIRNGNGGRDHWLTNACFGFGPDLAPGVYGASSDEGMAPMAVDVSTGAPDPGGDIPKPEHVLASLFATLGYTDPATMPNDLRVGPYAALLRS